MSGIGKRLEFTAFSYQFQDNPHENLPTKMAPRKKTDPNISKISSRPLSFTHLRNVCINATHKYFY